MNSFKYSIEVTSEFYVGSVLKQYVQVRYLNVNDINKKDNQVACEQPHIDTSSTPYSIHGYYIAIQRS